MTTDLRALSDAATPGRWRSFGMTLMVGGDGDYDDATKTAIFLTERDGHPRTFDLDLACAAVNDLRERLAATPDTPALDGGLRQLVLSEHDGEWHAVDERRETAGPSHAASPIGCPGCAYLIDFADRALTTPSTKAPGDTQEDPR